MLSNSYFKYYRVVNNLYHFAWLKKNGDKSVHKFGYAKCHNSHIYKLYKKKGWKDKEISKSKFLKLKNIK